MENKACDHKIKEQGGKLPFPYRPCCFHTGHVAFPNISNLEKLEYVIENIFMRRQEHGHIQPNGIRRIQCILYYMRYDAQNVTTCPV